MKKIIQLKTIRKDQFKNPEHFDTKIKRLLEYCDRENKNKHLKGQKFDVKVSADYFSATLYLEVDEVVLNKNKVHKYSI